MARQTQACKIKGDQPTWPIHKLPRPVGKGREPFCDAVKATPTSHFSMQKSRAPIDGYPPSNRNTGFPASPAHRRNLQHIYLKFTFKNPWKQVWDEETSVPARDLIKLIFNRTQLSILLTLMSLLSSDESQGSASCVATKWVISLCQFTW